MNSRRTWRRWLAGLGLVTVGCSFAAGQDVRPAGAFRRVQVPCPCPTPAAPAALPCPTPPDAAMPPDAASPLAPGTLPPIEAPQPDAVAAAPAFVQAPSAGTGGSASIAPNLMGDLFGARSAIITLDRQLTVTFPNPLAVPGGLQVTPSTATVLFSPLPGQGGDTVPGGPFQQLTRVNPYVQQVLPGQTVITQQQGEQARAILQSLISSRGLSPAQLLLLPPDVRANLVANQNAINQSLTEATGGLPVPLARVGPVTGVVDPETGNVVYSTILSGETVVALPGSGSTVGRIKMAEDNNPLPRDRFIFVYDHFNNVPFTLDGVNVNRFQFGVEKTFLDGRWSAEFRLPFAGTLASTYTVGSEVTDTELGNLRLALKRLWTRDPNAAVKFASGVGVTLPTADDTIVRGGDGVELYRFENNSVQVEPFVAALFTPNDRLFGQVWSSVNFDTSGGDLTWNRDVFGGSGSERIWDLPVLAVDGQIGYWLFRSDTSAVRGLAPFVELHWNYAIAQDRLIDEVQDEVRSEGLRIDATAANELNITAGVTSQIGDNLLVTVGGSAPLLKRPDRTFDGQFGVRVNYLFGPTAARARTIPGYYVSGY